MFGRARWRLTVWFAGAFVLILVVVGGAVFLTVRTVLYDQVNNDLRVRAGREQAPLVARILDNIRQGGDLRNVEIGPAFTAGGYFYALLNQDGDIVGSTQNTDPQGLPDAGALETALTDGPSFEATRSSEGEHLRVYLVPLQTPRGQQFVLEVGRSVEPERQALGKLLLVLLAGGGAGLALAMIGGHWLSGLALRPIQAAMDRQRAFVADASHEIRTPLALIRANAEILKREAEMPVRANMASVDDVIEETDRLSGIVGQMLTLAKADGAGTALKLTPLDLSEVAADAVQQMRLLAEPREITLELHSNGATPVAGDPIRLRELLTILLDNAIKYAGGGATVSVDARQSGDRALLQVADNGPGIPEEALPRIFDRFYRVDKARSRETGGAGLGLAIAKWIVDSHKGTIAIDGSAGGGTTVRVELPAA